MTAYSRGDSLPDHELREQLAAGCLVLDWAGQNDLNMGHLSVRRAGADVFWMKPLDLDFGEVRPEDMVLLDFDGKLLAGNRPRHSEYAIHAEMYRYRPDVRSVLHTHPPFATALSALDVEFHAVNNQGAAVLAPHIPRFTEHTDLIWTREQGESLVTAMRDARSLLLRNHGIVVASPSLEETVVTAVFLETAARAQLLVLSTGSPYAWTSDDELPLKHAHLFAPATVQLYWQYLSRKADQAARSFRSSSRRR